MKKVLYMFLFTALCCAPAFAQRNVAVLEIERRGVTVNEISREEAMEITGVIRGAAVRTLPRGRYSVMTSETVQAMGGAVLAECFDETCVIALGRTIDAEYIMRGVLSKFQTVYTLNIEMFETEYGNLVATSEPVRSENLMDILSISGFATIEMIETFLGSGVQQPQVSQQQPRIEQRGRMVQQNIAPTTDMPMRYRSSRRKHHWTYLGGSLGIGIYEEEVRRERCYNWGCTYDYDYEDGSSVAASFVADFPLLSWFGVETGAIIGNVLLGAYAMGRLGYTSERFELTYDMGYLFGSMGLMAGLTTGFKVGPGMLFFRFQAADYDTDHGGWASSIKGVAGYKIGIGRRRVLPDPPRGNVHYFQTDRHGNPIDYVIDRDW